MFLDEDEKPQSLSKKQTTLNGSTRFGAHGYFRSGQGIANAKSTFEKRAEKGSKLLDLSDGLSMWGNG